MAQRRTESLLRCSRASCESAPTRGSLRVLARGLTPSTSAVYCSSSRTRRSCLPDQGIGRSSRVCAWRPKRVATSYKTLGSLRSLSNPAASGSRRTGITRASRGSTGENRPNVSHVLRHSSAAQRGRFALRAVTLNHSRAGAEEDCRVQLRHQRALHTGPWGALGHPGDKAQGRQPPGMVDQSAQASTSEYRRGGSGEQKRTRRGGAACPRAQVPGRLHAGPDRRLARKSY